MLLILPEKGKSQFCPNFLPLYLCFCMVSIRIFRQNYKCLMIVIYFIAFKLLFFFFYFSFFQIPCEMELFSTYRQSWRSGRYLTIVAVEFKLKKTGKLAYTARGTFYNNITCPVPSYECVVQQIWSWISQFESHPLGSNKVY